MIVVANIQQLSTRFIEKFFKQSFWKIETFYTKTKATPQRIILDLYLYIKM